MEEHLIQQRHSSKLPNLHYITLSTPPFLFPINQSKFYSFPFPDSDLKFDTALSSDSQIHRNPISDRPRRGSSRTFCFITIRLILHTLRRDETRLKKKCIIAGDRVTGYHHHPRRVLILDLEFLLSFSPCSLLWLPSPLLAGHLTLSLSLHIFMYMFSSMYTSSFNRIANYLLIFYFMFVKRGGFMANQL